MKHKNNDSTKVTKVQFSLKKDVLAQDPEQTGWVHGKLRASRWGRRAWGSKLESRVTGGRRDGSDWRAGASCLVIRHFCFCELLANRSSFAVLLGRLDPPACLFVVCGAEAVDLEQPGVAPLCHLYCPTLVRGSSMWLLRAGCPLAGKEPFPEPTYQFCQMAKDYSGSSSFSFHTYFYSQDMFCDFHFPPIAINRFNQFWNSLPHLVWPDIFALVFNFQT